MASNYVAFDVMTEDANGIRTPVPNQTVTVYDATNAAALDDLISNADGHIPAGELDVAAGTTVRFSADLGDGRMDYAEQVTT